MAFVRYNPERDRPFFRYLFLSLVLHLAILLISKIIILHPSTKPVDKQFLVKLMDSTEPSEIPIFKPPKSTNPRRSGKVKKPTPKASISGQARMTQLRPPIPFDRATPVIPPPVLEKPILPSVKIEAHISQKFLKEGKEGKIYSPQTTYKDVLSTKFKEIEAESAGLSEIGQIATDSQPPPSSKLGEGREISEAIEKYSKRHGFKEPSKALAIGESISGTNIPLEGNSYIPLNSKDPNLAPYLAYIKDRILQFWRYPEEAPPGLKGQIDLAFIVERDGNVSQIKIVSSSKFNALDKGVLEALERANPFKPIPSEIKEKSLPLIGTFLYNESGYNPNQPNN